MNQFKDEILNSKLNDGFFKISLEKEGVFLTVYSPVGQGKRVEVAEVLQKLKEKQIRNYKVELVEQAVKNMNAIPVKIAENQDEQSNSNVISLTVTPDKMKAYITIATLHEANRVSKDDVLKFLENSGITYGIKQDVLEDIIRFEIYNTPVCIAEGDPPVNGEDGRIEYMFNINNDVKPTILEDGRVDFRRLNIIQNVKKGDILCTLIPPTPGIPGKNINGKNIPARDGKRVALPKGRNVEVTEDGMRLRSVIDGQVTFDDGKVNVFSNYEVKADVDNSTGNISFVGNVIIRGNVLSGFVVEAEGFVEVWGVVEGAVIKAAGDIILRKGMQGRGKGVLISGGDIIAKYIEHSNIEAKNDIRAEAIMHSNVKCGNKLELCGKAGQLVGGVCRVGREVVAKVIGSDLATLTEIEVGIDPAIKERYKQLKTDMKNMENDVKKADQVINILKKMEAAGTLTPEKQEMLARSVRTKIFYTNEIQQIREELLKIEAILQEETGGKIKVSDFLYSGVKVSIGNCTMYIKDTLQHCSLYRDGADIKVGPLK